MNLDFNTLFDSFQPTSSFINASRYQNGYVKGSFDITLQKFFRTQSSSKSSLMDYDFLTQDKNFSRTKSQQNLEKGMAKYSAFTQLVHVAQNQLIALGVYEYLPSSVQDFIVNFQTFSNTGLNFMSLFKQDLSFKKVAAAFTSDLINQYAAGNIYLQTLLNIANAVENNNTYNTLTPNNAIRELLSLNVLSLLGTDGTAITETLEYISNVSLLFTTDNGLNSFTAAYKSFLDNFNGTQAGKVVKGSYTSDISTDDPFGIELNNSFRQDMITQFGVKLDDFLSSQITNADYTDLRTILIEDMENNINTAMETQGYPSISKCISGVQKDIANKTNSAFVQAVQDVGTYIIQDIGVTDLTSETLTPIDYLFNLHRNIQAREKIFSQNDSISNVNTNSDYFTQVLGKNYTSEAYTALVTKMNGLTNNG